LGEDADLEPGEYYIYCKAQWREKEKDEIVISAYGEDKC